MNDVETTKLLEVALKGARIVYVSMIDYKRNERMQQEFLDRKIVSEFEPLLKKTFPSISVLVGTPNNNEHIAISYAFTNKTFVLVLFRQSKATWVAVYHF